MDVRSRLQELSAELARLRTEVGILDEQIAYQQEVASDARLRAIVSETPLAERESRAAADDLARLVRSRGDLEESIAEAKAEQDRLLEGMIREKPDG